MTESTLPGGGRQADLPQAPTGSAAVLCGLILVLFAGLLYVSPSSGIAALLVFGIGIPALWCVWTWPQLGLLGVVFLSLGLVPAVINVRVQGGLDLRDLLLLGMLALALSKTCLEGRRLTLPLPWVAPLLAFLALAVGSAIYATTSQGVVRHWALSELRPLIYYTVCFLTAWTICTRRQLIAFVASLFVLADLTASVLVLQQFLGRGNPVLAAMRSNEWYVRDQGGTSNAFGAVRIVPPGHVLVYTMSIVAFSLLFTRLSRRVRILLVLELVYLNFGLLFTYTRAQWLASAVALAIVVVLLPLADKFRVMTGVVVLTLAYSLLSFGLHIPLTHSALFSNVSTRVASIFTPSKTLQSSSLSWRVYETHASIRSIEGHPLLGVGLGNSYRQVTLLDGEARGWLAPLEGGNFRGLTRFGHDSFLHIAVKMGLPALAFFLWFCVAYLVRAWQTYRWTSAGAQRRIAVALLASFVGTLLWSITEHNLLQVDGAVAIGLMVGITATLHRLNQRAPAQADQPPAIPGP